MVESLNRAFMYGESVFTTLRMVDGSLRDWESHFERLRRGVEFVYGPFVEGKDWVSVLKDRLETRARAESGNKVVRLTVYREQARGLVCSGLVSVSNLGIHLNAAPFDPEKTEGRPIKLRTCTATMRPHWWPSYLKAGSYLEVILAQKNFLRPGDNDLLMLSPNDTVLASSVANVFVVRHDKLYTAPTGPNVLEGVMRRKIIEAAHDFFTDFVESESTMEQLIKADAVFCSNSVRGPFLIGCVDDHEITPSEKFLEKFQLLRERLLK